MLLFTALIAGSLFLAAPQEPVQQSDGTLSLDVWQDHALANGTQLSLVHAEQLEDQAFFLVFPQGLVLDGAGEVQWSHVLEHVLRGAVDPDHDLFTTQGLRVATETTQSTLRLEVYAPAARWQAGLELLTEWLAVPQLDAKGLAAEKSRIAEELRAMIPKGQTHKWAAAAWGQAVRHGAKHVRISGELAELQVEAVNQQLLPRANLGPGVRLLSVGPVDPAKILAAVNETLGVMGSGVAHEVAPVADLKATRSVRDRTITWDMSGRHYLEAFLLPDENAGERVAADTLALLANQRVAQTPSLEQRGFLISAAVDHLTPEGRWFVLSSPLPSNQSVETLKTAFRQLLTSIQSAPETPLALSGMRRELSVWPDFAALREANAGNPALRDVEARQALFLLYAQLNMGLTLKQLNAEYAGLDRDQVDALARRLFREPNRAGLLIEPID